MKKTPAPYHHGDLRQALVVEAAKIVETEGTAALTLRELARRLGVSHAAPGHHFADKAALIAELAADGFAELAVQLESTASSASSAGNGRGGSRGATARLRETGRSYVRFALARPGHFRVMFGGALGEASPSARLAENGGRAYAALRSAVAAALSTTRATSDERIERASFFAWSVVHGAAVLLLDGPNARRPGGPAGTQEVQALVDDATEVAAEAVARSF